MDEKEQLRRLKGFVNDLLDYYYKSDGYYDFACHFKSMIEDLPMDILKNESK